MNHPDTLNVLQYREQLSQQWSLKHLKTIQAVERTKLKQQMSLSSLKPKVETPRKAVKTLWVPSMATTQASHNPRPATSRRSDGFFTTEVPELLYSPPPNSARQVMSTYKPVKLRSTRPSLFSASKFRLR